MKRIMQINELLQDFMKVADGYQPVKGIGPTMAWSFLLKKEQLILSSEMWSTDSGGQNTIFNHCDSWTTVVLCEVLSLKMS